MRNRGRYMKGSKLYHKHMTTQISLGTNKLPRRWRQIRLLSSRAVKAQVRIGLLRSLEAWATHDHLGHVFFRKSTLNNGSGQDRISRRESCADD